METVGVSFDCVDRSLSMSYSRVTKLSSGENGKNVQTDFIYGIRYGKTRVIFW